MADVIIANTSPGIASKTLACHEVDGVTTGLWTFSRGAAAPFVVNAGAAAVANLNADRIDGADFQTGTWTPALGGSGGASGVTYVGIAGEYAKLGALVYAAFYIALSAKGTITGNLQIQGLPFAPVNTGIIRAVPLVWHQLATTWVNITGQLTGGVPTIVLAGAPVSANTNSASLTASDLQNNSILGGFAVYLTP